MYYRSVDFTPYCSCLNAGRQWAANLIGIVIKINGGFVLSTIYIIFAVNIGLMPCWYIIWNRSAMLFSMVKT